MITIQHYLVVGALLFTLGLIGFLTRRNLIVMFLSAEMMLQGVAINFVAFSKQHGNMHGQIFTLFIIAVAACEAGIALALFLVLYQRQRSLDVSLWQSLREQGVEETRDLEPLEEPTPEVPEPELAHAGHQPTHTEEQTHD